MSKKIVTRYEDIRWQLDGCTIDEAITVLTELKSNPKFTNQSKIEIDCETSYGDTFPTCTLSYTREETDQELKSRLDWEKSLQERRRKDFERLKKEFG